MATFFAADFASVSRQLSEIASELEVSITDIYQQASQEFYAKHSLPAFHEWGDGFVQGDAGNDETLAVATTFGITCEVDEDGEYDFSELFSRLDSDFIELYVEKANEAFESSKKVTEKEIDHEETESSNYVTVFAADAADAEIAVQEYLDEKSDADRYDYQAQKALPILGGEYGISEVKWKVRYNC